MEEEEKSLGQILQEEIREVREKMGPEDVKIFEESQCNEGINEKGEEDAEEEELLEEN